MDDSITTLPEFKMTHSNFFEEVVDVALQQRVHERTVDAQTTNASQCKQCYVHAAQKVFVGGYGALIHMQW